MTSRTKRDWVSILIMALTIAITGGGTASIVSLTSMQYADGIWCEAFNGTLVSGHCISNSVILKPEALNERGPN